MLYIGAVFLSSRRPSCTDRQAQEYQSESCTPPLDTELPLHYLYCPEFLRVHLLVMVCGPLLILFYTIHIEQPSLEPIQKLPEHVPASRSLPYACVLKLGY